jgi:transcriptional regulator with XRE-family HTH domain
MAEDLTKRLRKAIKQQMKAGVTRYAIAAKSGVDYAQISRFACGERDLRLSPAARLAEALDLELVEPGNHQITHHKKRRKEPHQHGNHCTRKVYRTTATGLRCHR